jgi:hypothetical protein
MRKPFRAAAPQNARSVRLQNGLPTAFLERIARVNTDPHLVGRVTRVVLFSSILNQDTEGQATPISPAS